MFQLGDAFVHYICNYIVIVQQTHRFFHGSLIPSSVANKTSTIVV